MRMMIALLLSINSVFSYGLTVNNYEKKIKTLSNIKNLVEKVSKKDLEDSMREFVYSGRPNRFFGSSGNINSREFILSYLNKLNSENSKVINEEFTPNIEEQISTIRNKIKNEFSSKENKKDPNKVNYKNYLELKIKILQDLKNIKGKNIIWEKKGMELPNEVITIFSNYDTLNVDSKNLNIDIKGNMPGADRNASGVVIALNLATLLNQLDLKKTVRIVFLDGDELGNLGFQSYIKTQQADFKNILAINLFMLGNDTKNKDTEQKIGNFKAYVLLNDSEFLKTANDFLKVGKQAFSNLEFKLSDQKDYFDVLNYALPSKFPLMVLSENWETDLNPRNQTSDDFVETINFQTLINCYKNISSSLIALVFDIVK